MEVDLGKHEVDLVLGEIWVHHRQWDAVKREIPRGVPRVLPFVGHRNDIVVDHVEPRFVPAARDVRAAKRVRAALAQPHVEIEVVALLRPEHP